MYLPYCSRANTDEFLPYLGKLSQLCEELQCPNICFVGDFNTGTTNTFGGLFEDFCMENDFIISDYAILPQDTFTYISDARNTTSWIDHFVSSFSVHQAMLNMDVLTECIISDHRAVAVSIQYSHPKAQAGGGAERAQTHPPLAIRILMYIFLVIHQHCKSRSGVLQNVLRQYHRA